jgi:hypothetical protein
METISALVGGVIGFLSSILSEPIRNRLFGPKLLVDFNPTQQGCVTMTKEGSPVHGYKNASYIRVLITNKGRGIAKQCRAYLINFEVWNPSRKRFEKTIYCEAIQLAWSASPERPYDPVDIPNDVHKFVDLASVRENSSTVIVHLITMLNRYVEMLTQEKGRFRYTVLVAGENCKSQSAQVVIEWNGNYGEFREKYAGN